MSTKRSYHHGDARNALIEAASGILEREGATGLSLRGVADVAGLSRQAPYNHFDDKESLLAALVLNGFTRLATALRSAIVSLTGEAALSAAAETYIGFAQDAPALFRLMFTRELVDLSRFPEARAAADEAFAVLGSAIATKVTAGHIDDLKLAAWCIVHGYATLCNEAAIETPDRRQSRARLFARMISTLDA